MVDRDRDVLQSAARHLLQHPLTCIEHFPEQFAQIRRHEVSLDRWFTQRLGYRLHVSSFTARLFKTTIVSHRPVLVAPTSSKRAMNQRECVLLSLILAAVASGPRVISLRDLIDDVRTAAADAEVKLSNEAIDRRAFIIALKWMIQAGMATELHEHIDRYEQDDTADAILEIDPDRVGLLPLAILGRADSAQSLLDRSERRASVRQWLRAQLVENPAVYRTDLTEQEWSALRRRIGEEVALLDQMFGLRVESRAEGVAAIDPSGHLSDRLFPTTGTVGHAALLLIDWISVQASGSVTINEAQLAFDALAQKHKRHWSKTKAVHLGSFLNEVLELLVDLRLVHRAGELLNLLPAAARYSVVTMTEERTDNDDWDSQATIDVGQPLKTATRTVSQAERPDDDRQGSLW